MTMAFTAKTFDELTTAELYEILKARAAVFVMEENIHYLDMDDVDYRALHCFMADGRGRVMAYLRAYPSADEPSAAQIGRVLTRTRGKGVGRELMERGMAAVQSRLKVDRICMDSQSHAIGFYEKLGFAVTSAEFLEENVPHVKMELRLGQR